MYLASLALRALVDDNGDSDGLGDVKDDEVDGEEDETGDESRVELELLSSLAISPGEDVIIMGFDVTDTYSSGRIEFMLLIMSRPLWVARSALERRTCDKMALS